MNKLSVGEYVRTKKGLIFKATEYWLGELTEEIKDNIKAHSKNIAELLEIGDYVNGEKVFGIQKDPFIKGQIDIFFNRHEVDYWGDRSLAQITDKDIKSIVTHEKIEEFEYRV